jgi:hypothetical protein
MVLENIVESMDSVEHKNKSGFLKQHHFRNALTKTIGVAAIAASCFLPGTLYAQSATDTAEKPAAEIIVEETAPVVKNVETTIGSISLGAGYEVNDFAIGKYEGIPIVGSASLGLNILNRDRYEGTILFPNLKAVISKNKPEYDWDNQAELSVGAIGQLVPFTLGAEMVYKIPFGVKDNELYFRAWASYWGDWQAKPLTDSQVFPLKFWGTQSIGIRYDNSMKNGVAEAQADINLDLMRIGKNPPREYTYPGLLGFNGVTITPFIAATGNFDITNEPWNRFVQGSAGIKLIEGGYQIVSEVGYRKSLNASKYEGMLGSIEFQIWLPLDFGMHKVQRK